MCIDVDPEFGDGIINADWCLPVGSMPAPLASYIGWRRRSS